ncbi:MAG: BTAD domain-containing putative transcriptional regulator, partial [Chloroflexota bacterium]
MARLALSFLGTFQVMLDGKPVTSFRSVNVQCLLAYLAIESGRPHQRNVLAALLWPDEPDAIARQNLRQSLYLLGQALGGKGGSRTVATTQTTHLVITRQTAQFDPTSDHTLDVAGFLAALQRGQVKEAMASYQGDLLAGLFCQSVAFEEWLLVTRERLHRLAVDACSQLTHRFLQQAAYDQAQHYALRQLALEPWREEAYRQSMQALARSGQRSAALDQYRTCRRILADELGAEPAAETTALYEQIRGGEQEPPPSLPSPTPSYDQRRTQDWGDAPETAALHGRQTELARLTQWLVDDGCRLVAILGMGGLGKTALAAHLAHQTAHHYRYVIWRSLLNAPRLTDVLGTWLQFLSGQPLSHLPDDLDEQLALLSDRLHQQRCLLVLDNVESVLQGAGEAGRYRPGYEDYERLLRRVAERGHQSCLLLTSRERPWTMARLEHETSAVRSLPLVGLDEAAGVAILQQRGLSDTTGRAGELVARYSGNPLALKLAAETIRDLFGGDVSAFLGAEAAETPIFADIRDVLDQQFARLSAPER